MKKIPASALLLLAILCHLSSAAQKEKFIEISATDTIRLKAVAMTYQVRSGPPVSAFVVMPSPATDDSTVAITTIARVLAQNNFAPKFAGSSTYRLPGIADSTISVDLTSAGDLKRLYDLLRKYPGLSGQVSETTYEPIDAYKSASFQRLYDRARQDAATLANISGGSLGKLISVQEPASSIIQDMMSGYSKAMQKNEVFSGLFSGDSVATQTIERRLVFRFELK